MNAELKQLIFNKLYKRLSNAEIIPYNGSVWFIDREEKYWYFELENNGNLYWRYTFFNKFFKMFSMEPNQFEPIISEWVEEVLNHKVSTTALRAFPIKFKVEEVLNHKISKTKFYVDRQYHTVEEVLNHKVSATNSWDIAQLHEVEEVLNHKVSTTNGYAFCPVVRVEEVLNHKVSTTHLSLHNLHDLVEDVLNENPTE